MRFSIPWALASASLVALTACGAAVPENAGAPASDARAAAATLAPVAPAPKARPKVEVCFVLDTTGSMSGLIEGAKQKIWAIANDITRAQPTPELKIALLAYRDKNDEYVTKLYDLSDDIDAVYGHLKEFTANGGGDEPESVNQALYEAVNKVAWSTDKSVLKVIFLVGDAPPHMDYPNDIKYPETCQAAAKKDLIINTVQCGQIAATGPIWQDIAHLSEGSFVAIGQTGDMTVTSTPMDSDLARLNHEIAGTAVAYGDERRRTEVASKLAAATTAPASWAADRAGYMGKTASVAGPPGASATPAAIVSGGGELIHDLEGSKVKLADLKDAELPAEMQKLDAPARQAYVEKQTARRRELQGQIDDLSKKRQDYLDQQRAQDLSAGRMVGFDAQVARMVQEQAQRKGIQYDLPGAAAQPAAR